VFQLLHGRLFRLPNQRHTHNALLQTGVGRCGRLWAHEAYEGFTPDLMTIAKPLANGLPIGAVLMTDAVAACIQPGDHGTTFGGNPLVATAAVEVLSRISAPGFLEATRARGAQLIAGMRTLQARYPSLIKEVCTKLPSLSLLGGTYIFLPALAAGAVCFYCCRSALPLMEGYTSARICRPPRSR
jgi:hypothetical protein